MKTPRIQFGMKPETPALAGPGIAIAAPRAMHSISGGVPLWIHGSCRIPRGFAGAERLDVPRGVFVTAVEIFRQQPVTSCLIGDHVVFEDDVEDTGAEYAVFFSFDLLKTVALPRAPFTFIVHASFFGQVSNFLRIEFTQ